MKTSEIIGTLMFLVGMTAACTLDGSFVVTGIALALMIIGGKLAKLFSSSAK